MLTVRDVGKVRYKCSPLFQPRSSTTPGTRPALPPPSASPSPSSFASIRCSSCSFSYSPLSKDVSPSSQCFFLSARFLRCSSRLSFPLFVRRSVRGPRRGGGWCWCTTPTRWSPTHRNPPSQADALSRKRERERKR